MRFFTARNCLNITLGLLLLLAAGCGDPQVQQDPQVRADTAANSAEKMAIEMNGKFSDQTRLNFDSTTLSGFFLQYDSLKPYRQDVATFYQKRKYCFAWYDTGGLIETAGNFYARLQNLPAEGITAGVPYLRRLDSLMENRDDTTLQQETETDLLLSSLYFYFAHRVWTGLGTNATASMQWYLPRKKVSYETWLDSLLKTPGAFTKAEEPVFRQYPLLKVFLKKYRDLEKLDPSPSMPASHQSLRLNDSAATITGVKKKLWLMGDLPEADTSPVFNTSLLQAVKNFQHRYGMQEDGIIGTSMIKELNTPWHHIIEKILVNMERSRWLPMPVSQEYFAVNIPEFRLHLFTNDTLAWSMNVVVGKSMNKTVIFSGRLKYVVFSPYWNVPSSIYKKDILPGIRRDRNYLAKHHMERFGNGVRQLPGPWNSLGKVKFLFPNSYSIYFHDTPAKNLFGESRRAFSHGCIRLAEPEKMAAWLLRKDSAWNTATIEAAMNSGKEQYVTLSNEVPVYITYFTAWVNRKGELNLRSDIYDRDKRLLNMIMATR